jgi:hypothetical protein
MLVATLMVTLVIITIVGFLWVLGPRQSEAQLRFSLLLRVRTLAPVRQVFLVAAACIISAPCFYCKVLIFFNDHTFIR